jgi:NMD protein affecting ribosome stability and mRNA decay
MLCYSCSKQKNELMPKKSSIISGITLLMCQSCLDEKLEPRWVVILGGRKNGAESVREYIIKRRYIGKSISAEELIA